MYIKKFNKFICFLDGTQILLKNGNKKAIELIKTGDIVLSYDLSKKRVESVIVSKVASSMHSIINAITFSNGVEIKSTTDHPYWVDGKGWCSVNAKSTRENYVLSVDKLLVGDTCMLLENGKMQKVTITNIDTEIGEFKMYDISGGKNNCFFANGILVHDENLMELNLVNKNIQYSTMASL